MIAVGDISAARILIVDDEPVNVCLLERVLLSAGYTSIRSTSNSGEAMSIVESFQPDLVMLDLHMPEPDGYALLASLQQQGGAAEFRPVLVLTADVTQGARHRALSSGAKDFVTKPFDRTEVLARTKNLLEARLLHAALKQANVALEEKLVHQSLHDPLTGLANRALFHDRVALANARVARGDTVAALFLDLDNFKAVNDSLGHAEGDRLLEAVARRLLQATRGCDTVSRLGGDEFGVLIDGFAHEDDVLVVVERISASLRHPVALNGREVIVGASIGVSYVEPGQSVHEVLRNADVAMYRAKAAGGGSHVVFEPGMYTAVMERLELEADLRRALLCGEFRLFYQPIVDLENGRTIGLEALLRWEHPTRGLMSPLAFVPLAEETGLIVPIGRWVIAEACRQARRWQLECSTGHPPTMSVNVSGRQLLEASLVEEIGTALVDSGLDPSLLTIEITESVLMQDAEATLSTLHALKGLGVRLAIDDFGTGYSSLSYLQRFPIDVLKIDKTFIDGIAKGGSDSVLARSIVTMASMLDLKTVAEGVEFHDQYSQLIELGCARGQGYLFGRPLASDEIAKLLREPVDQRALLLAS
jgi:diguanylate cyclase (GGDEF)-like protein